MSFTWIFLAILFGLLSIDFERVAPVSHSIERGCKITSHGWAVARFGCAEMRSGQRVSKRGQVALNRGQGGLTPRDNHEVEFPEGCSIDSLRSLEFLHDHNNIIMYGGTGTGKTMLSICIGLTACGQNIPVRFLRTASLVNTLSSKMKSGKLDSFREKLFKASIYILDEFGYVPYDRDGINILFDFLSEISDDPTKVVILNTNLEFSRWVNVLYDQKMTAALIGRLTHHCHLILFPGENNRLKESSINMIYRNIADRQERIKR